MPAMKEGGYEKSVRIDSALGAVSTIHGGLFMPDSTESVTAVHFDEQGAVQPHVTDIVGLCDDFLSVKPIPADSRTSIVVYG